MIFDASISKIYSRDKVINMLNVLQEKIDRQAYIPEDSFYPIKVVGMPRVESVIQSFIKELMEDKKEDMKTAEEVAKDIENREFTSDGMSDESWEEYMREKGVTESEIRIAASKCIEDVCFSLTGTGPESIETFGTFVYGVVVLMKELIEKCESEENETL